MKKTEIYGSVIQNDLPLLNGSVALPELSAISGWTVSNPEIYLSSQISYIFQMITGKLFSHVFRWNSQHDADTFQNRSQENVQTLTTLIRPAPSVSQSATMTWTVMASPNAAATAVARSASFQNLKVGGATICPDILRLLLKEMLYGPRLAEITVCISMFLHTQSLNPSVFGSVLFSYFEIYKEEQNIRRRKTVALKYNEEQKHMQENSIFVSW